MILGWRAVAPSVDFTDATTTLLEDNPAAWPERFYVSGFTYERFGLPDQANLADVWDWRKRLSWLMRQAAYDAGPYEQAARVFRQHGYANSAEEILIAQKTHGRMATTWRAARPLDFVNALYGWTVGYGYRPSRVLGLLALLLILVASSLLTRPGHATLRAHDESGNVYSTSGLLDQGAAGSASDPCGNGMVRCFQPILYAIDTVVPLVSLDQRSTWYPDPYVRWGRFMEWWLNLATVAGWLMSSIFVLSFARLARTA